MKKLFIFSVVVLTAFAGKSQQVVDTVSTGPSYLNQVYYKLSNGAETPTSVYSWDIAFQTGIMSGGIWLNQSLATSDANTIKAYVYPGGNASAQNFSANWDTVGYTTWQRINNPDSTWDWGGFNTTSLGGVFDYGWGNYAGAPTHNVLGDSLYLFVKGTTLKKMWIVAKVSLDNKYVVRTANIDGSNDDTDTLSFNPYLSKSLAYYTLGSGTLTDNEPAVSQWDLLFTRYNGQLFGLPNQIVTGVLANPNVQIAKAYPVNDVNTFIDTTGIGFSNVISTIGADWKTPPPPAWTVEDSLVYFTLRGNELYKLVFTGFGGAANGNYIFWKENLSGGTAVNENSALKNVTLYPNPTNGEVVTLVYTLENAAKATYTIYDLAGKMIDSQTINGQPGLHTTQIANGNLAPGMYIVNLMVGNTNRALKLVVR